MDNLTPCDLLTHVEFNPNDYFRYWNLTGAKQYATVKRMLRKKKDSKRKHRSYLDKRLRRKLHAKNNLFMEPLNLF